MLWEWSSEIEEKVWNIQVQVNKDKCKALQWGLIPSKTNRKPQQQRRYKKNPHKTRWRKNARSTNFPDKDTRVHRSRIEIGIVRSLFHTKLTQTVIKIHKSFLCPAWQWLCWNGSSEHCTEGSHPPQTACRRTRTTTHDSTWCHRVRILLKFLKKGLKQDCVFFKNSHLCGSESKPVCTQYRGEEKELIIVYLLWAKEKVMLSIQQERFGKGTKKTRVVRTVESCDTLL